MITGNKSYLSVYKPSSHCSNIAYKSMENFVWKLIWKILSSSTTVTLTQSQVIQFNTKVVRRWFFLPWMMSCIPAAEHDWLQRSIYQYLSYISKTWLKKHPSENKLNLNGNQVEIRLTILEIWASDKHKHFSFSLANFFLQSYTKVDTSELKQVSIK